MVTPRQFGPISRTFPRRASASVWGLVPVACRIQSPRFPLNPAEIMTAPPTPAAAHSRIAPGTVAAGVTTTARSSLPANLRERGICGHAQDLAARIHAAERPGKPALNKVVDSPCARRFPHVQSRQSPRPNAAGNSRRADSVRHEECRRRDRRRSGVLVSCGTGLGGQTGVARAPRIEEAVRECMKIKEGQRITAASAGGTPQQGRIEREEGAAPGPAEAGSQVCSSEDGWAATATSE